MMTCKGDDVTDVGIDPEVTKTTTVEMIEVARRGVRGLRRMCAEVSLKLGLMLECSSHVCSLVGVCSWWRGNRTSSVHPRRKTSP